MGVNVIDDTSTEKFVLNEHLERYATEDLFIMTGAVLLMLEVLT